VIPLDLRLKIWRAERRPRVLAGMGPWNPTPGKRRKITLDPSALQVIPVQWEQTGAESVQLR